VVPTAPGVGTCLDAVVGERRDDFRGKRGRRRGGILKRIQFARKAAEVVNGVECGAALNPDPAGHPVRRQHDCGTWSWQSATQFAKPGAQQAGLDGEHG